MECVTIKNLDINNRNKVYALVLEIKNAFAKNGNPYQKIRIRDTNKDEMEITAWEGAFLDTKAITTPVIMLLEIYGNKDGINQTGSVFYKLANSMFINGNMADFLPESKIDRNVVKDYLMGYVNALCSPLKEIVIDALTRNWHDFCTKALTNGLAYKTIGGIMEATYNLIKIVEPVIELQGLNRDLTIAGALLYYIGAAKTVDANFCETRESVLLGIGNLSFQEIVISVERLKARVGDNEEYIKMLESDMIHQLEHIVLSKEGKHASTLEAMTLKKIAEVSEETYVMKDFMEKSEYGEVISINQTKKYNQFYNNIG